MSSEHSYKLRYKVRNEILQQSVLLLISVSLSCAGFSQSSITPVDLCVEYMKSPSGLDVKEPRFSWKFIAANQHNFGQKQTAYRILVGSKRSGLQKNTGEVWDSKWINSDNMQLVGYRGKALQSDQTYYWKVQTRDEHGRISNSAIEHWSTGLFDPEEWQAKWIGSSQVFDATKSDCNIYDPWLRKTISLKLKPAKAVLFLASVGYHELYVNGKKVGDHVLAPVATDHTKRARYIAYDIAPYLRSGKNVVGIWLGASWSIFAPYATADKPRTPIVRAQAAIYDNQNKLLTHAETDRSWKTLGSPNKLLGNWSFGNYGGEIWDANKDISDWNTLNYNDDGWANAVEYNPVLKMSAQNVEPNRKLKEIHPVSIEARPDGTYRVDMGVNFAGWTNIKVNGTAGDTVRFLFSERHQDDMTFRIHNAYVIGKSGEGIFKNRFNYSSGRWITIKGLKSKPKLSDIKGWMIRTDFENASSFVCSDSLQNWIYERVKWTYENLSIGGYIVDCPQRERFGYGGDAHATSETGMFNYDLGAFYTKWLQDWRDVQGSESMVGDMNDTSWARKKPGSGRWIGNGSLPHSAPTYHGGGGPVYGGIVVTLPWLLYQQYGDTRVLEENFQLIEGWLGYLDSFTENNLLKRFGGVWDFLGDWLWPNATAEGMNNDKPQTLCFNNCYRVYNLRTAAKIARVLGKLKEAEKWENQAERSSKAIHAKYYNTDDHSYSDSSMANLAASLYGDVMPQDLRPKVMERLEKEILINKKGHIHVGITAGAMLFKVLRDANRDDLIYSMTSQTTYPSWGHMKNNDATTIWEMWEKDLPGHSLLHSSYLYPGAWYIDGVGGIKKDPSKPGFQNFIVTTPNIPEKKINGAKTSFNSPAGMIKTEWKKADGKLTLSLTVPPNTSATVYFTSDKPSEVQEKSGQAIRKKIENGKAIFSVMSGNYVFSDQ